MRTLIIMVAATLFVSCGKNTGIGPVGGGFGPVPPVGNVPGYPNGYNPYGGQNQFYPQNVPAGYPNQYAPWMPLHQYMNQDVLRAQYYQQLMAQWYQYASFYQYNPYDFGIFWLNYAPVYFLSSPYPNVYHYLDSYFYHWVGDGTVYPSQYDAPAFWGNYRAFDFDWLDNN